MERGGRSIRERVVGSTVRGRIVRLATALGLVGTAAFTLPSLAGLASALTPWAPPASPSTSAPFNECPSVGLDTGCAVLIVLQANGGVTIKTDHSQLPYDGTDTLVGVLNESGLTIPSLRLTSWLPIFDFGNTGVCATGIGHDFASQWEVNGAPVTNACPYGSTGYEGPDVSFSSIAPDNKSGDVDFGGGLSNGASLFWSMENRLDSANFTVPTLDSLTSSVSQSSIVYGGSVTDTATAVGSHWSHATPAGTMSFYECGPSAWSCSSMADPVGSAVALVGSAGTSSAQQAFTPSSVGTYCFYTLYTGTNYLTADEPGYPGNSECVTVTPAPLTVAPTDATIPFGQAPAAPTPKYSGFVNGDSAASLTTPATCTTTATASSPVGTYPATCSGAVDPNYTISYQSGTVTVVPAGALTVTASSTTITAGSAVPAITPTFSNVKDGDTATSLASATTQPTCGTTATSASPPGTYPSTCSGAVDPNYSAIVYVPGTVTVVAAATTTSSSSGPVTGATTVHTGEPWAGSRPLVVGAGAAGLGILGLGLLRRRRFQSLTD